MILSDHPTRSRRLRACFAASLVIVFTCQAATAQVAGPSLDGPVPGATLAPVPTPPVPTAAATNPVPPAGTTTPAAPTATPATPTSVQRQTTLTTASTSTVTRRVHRRQTQTNSDTGVTFGEGGLSGGSSGLGVGLGVAGAALAVGFIGAMSRTSTYAGQNSTELATGPHPAGEMEAPRPIDDRYVRTPKAREAKPRAARAGFTLPARTETRFVPGEVLLVIKGDASPRTIKRLEAKYGLTPVATARINLLRADVRRYRLRPGTSVRAAISALQDSPAVTSAQPNYRFDLQTEPLPSPTKAALPPTDGTIAPSPIPTAGPVQYAVEMLRLKQAHRIASGTDIRIAVIDSGLDETNPDLKDSVVARFDAVGGAFRPHTHGTAIGGAIVAHSVLVGIAPKAKLIAIRAFTGTAAGADGAGFDILRGLDFAADNGARIINMSFAGPEDKLLESALEAARKRGIIEVAAAGNGGPHAKPLYPGAAPGVIAVTATDAEGRPFARANRGAYIAIAAPGENVIAPGLGATVQITSGTSIATAEASGVVALLLERDPRATPNVILKVLSATAHRLTVEPSAGGAGLIDAEAALAAVKRAP